MNDFEEMFEIWVQGTQEAFSNEGLDVAEKRDFHRTFFANALERQDRNFKIWGYVQDGELLGWQSLLPCQSAPAVWTKFAESSTYVKPGKRGSGIGAKLLVHAIREARHHSEIAYIMGFVSDDNTHVEKLIAEVGFVKVGVLPKSPKDTVIGERNQWSASDSSSLVRVSVWVVPL